jgi:hypothetical protein
MPLAVTNFAIRISTSTNHVGCGKIRCVKYGLSDSDWNSGLAQMKSILQKTARNRDLITYGDLSAAISATGIRVFAKDPAMDRMLYEVSMEELEKHPGAGIISALVVHKHGDRQPGSGFFDLAKSLGRDTSDPAKCWIEESEALWDHWASQ